MFRFAFGYVLGRGIWAALPVIVGVVALAAITTANAPTPDSANVEQFADVKANITTCGFSDEQIRGDFSQGLAEYVSAAAPDPYREGDDDSYHMLDTSKAQEALVQARLHESGVAEAEAQLATAQQRDRAHDAWLHQYGICYRALLAAGIMVEKEAKQGKPISKFRG
jgi:hypothetical protein